MLYLELIVGILTFDVASQWDHSVAFNCISTNRERTNLNLVFLESDCLLFQLGLQLILIVNVNFESHVELFLSFGG